MGVEIICGQSDQLVEGLGKFDVVLTDPPYAPGGARNEWKVSATTAIALHETAKAVKDGGTMIVLSASSGRGIQFTLGAIEPVLALNRVLTWHKTVVRSRAAGPWRWDTVLALVFGRGSWGQPQLPSCITTDSTSRSQYRGENLHPSEVPQEVSEWLAKPFGDIEGGGLRVLDPFCGSGSLLVPTLGWAKEVIGIEREEKWANLARERLTQ